MPAVRLGRIVQRHPRHPRPPRGGLVLGGQHHQQRRLSGTGRTDQGGDLAGEGLDVESLQGDDLESFLTVNLDQTFTPGPRHQSSPSLRTSWSRAWTAATSAIETAMAVARSTPVARRARRSAGTTMWVGGTTVRPSPPRSMNGNSTRSSTIPVGMATSRA